MKGMGAKGLARAKVDAEGNWTQSPLGKTVTPELRLAINAKAGAKDGDLLLFQFGREAMVQTVMANLRLHLGEEARPHPRVGHGGKWNFLWVVNPPLFEYDDEAKAGSPRTTPSPARTTSTWRSSRPTRAGALLPLRPRPQRLRDRRRLDPPPRSAGAGEGLPRAGHRRRRGAPEVRLPPRRA